MVGLSKHYFVSGFAVKLDRVGKRKEKGLFEYGVPAVWKITQYPKDASTVLIRDFRRKKPGTNHSIMAVYAQVFRERQPSPSYLYILHAMIRGYLEWPRKAIYAMRQQGRAARLAYNRSLFNQAIDMFRAWQICSLPPDGYYEGHIARHSGGVETTGYISWQVLANVVLALQR